MNITNAVVFSKLFTVEKHFYKHLASTDNTKAVHSQQKMLARTDAVKPQYARIATRPQEKNVEQFGKQYKQNKAAIVTHATVWTCNLDCGGSSSNTSETGTLRD